MFTHQYIRTPLVFCYEVSVFQVVAGEAFVASTIVVFGDGEAEAGKTVHVPLGANPVAALTELW